MAEVKITDLILGTEIATGDVFPYVDISDTTQAPSGSTKKVTIDTLEAYLNSNLSFVSTETDPVFTASPANSITDAGSGLVITAGERTDISTNNAKVTNATHTGDVTGSGALSIQPIAITGQTTVTGVSGDFVLISDTSDSGNLKKVDVVDFLGGGADTNFATDNLAFTANRTHTLSTFALNIDTQIGTILKLDDSDDSFTLGLNASSDSSQAVTIGQNASTLTASTAVAIGVNAKWNQTGFAGISIGNGAGQATTSFGNSSIVIGVDAGATTVGTSSVILGSNGDGSGTGVVALGGNSSATNTSAIAVGYASTASGDGSIVLGRACTASATNAYLLGTDNGGVNTNSVANSLALGFNGTSNSFLFAQTADTYLNGSGSILLGANTYAGTAKVYINGNLEVNGTITNSSSGSSGDFLQITVGGTNYKIDLHTV